MILFFLAANPTAIISSYLECIRRREKHWDVQFIKQFNDWEFDSVASMLGLLYSNIPRSDLDIMRWSLRGKGVFDVQSYCVQARKEISFPGRGIWCAKALKWVAFFVWTAMWEDFDYDNIRNRGIVLVDWYCLCRRKGESVNHLLLHN